MIVRDVSGASTVFLLGGLMAIGCSHSWDLLEPLGGAGGSASTTSTGGSGGDATGSTSSNSSSSDASSSGSSGSTGGGVLTAYYEATYAACNSEMELDPVACEKISGAGTMDIDAMTTPTNLVTRGFVRFDLDSTLVGKTVDSVTLRLTTLNRGSADSDKSGEIWKVTPFTAATLPLAQPTAIGDMVGADLGPVGLATDYFWELPKDLVAPNAPVFLGIDIGSTDGVRYWNHKGAVPPLLSVQYH